MKASVNQFHQFDLELKENELTLAGEKLDLDICQLSPRETHVIFQQQSHNLEVIGSDYDTKTFSVRVNGNTYEVVLEDQYDQLLKQMGMSNSQTAKLTHIKAPMPGLVLDIIAQPGSEVAKGDSLLILEAMKMENVIKSPSSGKIKSIRINKGDKVEKNQILIEFE